MRSARVIILEIAFFLEFSLLASSLHAGGPLLFDEIGNEETGAGQPFFWLNNQAVYVVEQGPVSDTLTNQVGAETVAKAFKRWTDVPMAELRVLNLEELSNGLSPSEREKFKRDITEADFVSTQCTIPGIGETSLSPLLCDMLTICVDHINQVLQGSRAATDLNCPSPIIFDEDGSIIARAFPSGVGVLGFSAPVTFSAPGGPSPQFLIRRGGQIGTGLFVSGVPIEPLRILQAFTVINGAFFGATAPFEDRLGNLEALLVHEFGHFLGLGHTNGPNGDTAALNPRPGEVSVQPLPLPSPRTDTLGPIDALSAIGFPDVETMYPFLLSKDAASLKKDDQTALSLLYPCSGIAVANNKCKENFFMTGTIAGRVFIPDAHEGSAIHAQGVLVTARQINPDSAEAPLKEAVSQFTGATFAPQCCGGVVYLDGDGDGILDNDGDGVPDNNNSQVFVGCFGACRVQDDPTTPDIDEGQVACNQQVKGLNPQYLFDGRCGWQSSTLNESRPTGAPAENHFELAGLSPGRYIVQAAPALIGGFSSPVRTSFFTTSPILQSDDAQNLALFPNPQVGEFYNGLPQGCESEAASCGNETGEDTDNPFAYTVIDVPAGGRIDNVNIFLNTATTRERIFSDPGFNFCKLGDVDNNGSVDQQDIVAVGLAKAAFDKDPGALATHQQADINQDGRITFLDLDIITDLVSLPDPFHAIGSQEIKRGLAPFEAICTAAKRDGCRIQAPIKTLQEDGAPSEEVCTLAKGIGCQVIGCP